MKLRCRISVSHIAFYDRDLQGFRLAAAIFPLDGRQGFANWARNLHSFSCDPKPQAASSARRASGHLDSGKLQSTEPIRSRCAMDMWSKFKAHSAGIPSSVVRTISVGKPRMVLVAGTAMISFN
jgi:hypothetical protein